MYGARSEPPRSTGRPERDPAPIRVATLVLIGLWLLIPFVVGSQASQDGPAFIAGAQLARHAPHELYPQGNDLERGSAERIWMTAYCAADPSGACHENHAGFLSPPSTALLYLPFTSFGPENALLLLRLCSALPITLAFLLAMRLADDGSSRRRGILFLSVLAATPIVTNTVVLGQNTGWVLLAGTACVWLTFRAQHRRSPRGRVPVEWSETVVGGLVAIAGLFKLFPFILLVPLVLHRRWRALVTTVAAVLTANSAALLLMGVSPWRAFVREIAWYQGGVSDDSFNRSLAAIFGRLISPEAASFASVAVAIGMVAVWIRRYRGRGPRPADMGYWLVLGLAVSAFVWPHYMLVVVPFFLAVVLEWDAAAWLLPIAMVLGTVAVLTWRPGGVNEVVGTITVMVLSIALPVIVSVRFQPAGGPPPVGP